MQDAEDQDVKTGLINGTTTSEQKPPLARRIWRSDGYFSESGAFLRENWVPMLANTLEWFEFATFAYLVDPISENFAHGDHVTVWFIFSLAFLCRPIGGFLIGHLGDMMGRKPAFWIASIAVVCSTVLQGALPSYRAGGKVGGAVGLAGLLCLRITQGLGIGGELGSGIIYLTETSPRRHVGMTMGFLSASSGLGFLFASFVAAALHSSGLTRNEIYDWGWRLPFLFAVIPGVLVLYLLNTIDETTVFQHEVKNRQAAVLGGGADDDDASGSDAGGENDVKLDSESAIVTPRHTPASPHSDALTKSAPAIVALFGMMAGAAAFWYVGCVYIFDWIRGEKATARDSQIMRDILWVAVLQNTVQLPTSIYFGYLTDRYGLRSVYPAVLGACLLAGCPIFALLDQSLSLPIIVLGPGVLFGIISGAIGTATNLLSSDIFPPQARHRGVGLGYNMSIMLFGGLGPAWVELTKNSIPLAAGLFLAVTAATSFLIYYFYGHSLLPAKEPKRAE
mmetsp:Transcript_31666/g.44112  ORF Transcript_31666/g.44112 Transcript_31666/m.44112 type:complete len:507 (+) Transcript_31666:56-1576(+)